MFKPVVVPHYFSNGKCDELIEYIDTQENLRMGSTPTVDVFRIFNPDLNDLIIEVTEQLKTSCYEIFNEENLIELSSAWFAKHILGGRLPAHDDATEPETSMFDYTAVAYLNQDFVGGEIVYPKINFTYSPKKGDVVFFKSKEPLATHEVLPIVSGVRYTMPVWFTTDLTAVKYGDRKSW